MASGLQTKDQEDLLNTIDLLRSQGISHYVDLPQLIVCGDQSSGKSSVLEAVSGIRFPTKDNLCTRFATELILRHSPEKSFNVVIVPDNDRSTEDKAKLTGFCPSMATLDQFPSIVDSAMDAMGLKFDLKGFSRDILRVELTGPDQPHLTLVDLPGLFSASSKIQSNEDAQLVKQMVLSYMRKTRSIILAVVSAKNDFANQIVTKHARDLDPMGHRTLGIITKPDTLHAGSDSEKAFVELAENRDVSFRLGWHVLRNRDYDTRDCTVEERDRMEEDFFSSGIWKTLSPTQVGIHSLKPRLSSVLRDQILSELPSLIEDVKAGIDDCHTKLDRLGQSRATTQEQRLHLLRASQAFSSLAKAAVDGVYLDSFFGDAKSEEGYSKRLRAVTQNTLLDFASEMREYGCSRDIIDDSTEIFQDAHPPQILRSKFIDEVSSQMKRSRGCELPGMFNPLIVGDLFYQHSQPWKDLVESFMAKLLEAARVAVNLIVEHTVDDATSNKLFRQTVNPSLDRLTQELRGKVSDILEPHQRGHPITYSRYMIDNVLKARGDRHKKTIASKLQSFFKLSPGTTTSYPKIVDVAALLETLTQRTETEMDFFGSSEAIDFMEAYYGVGWALSHFFPFLL